MTSKERMLLAIHKQTPDRLPVTIHQWQDYHLNTYMGGMTALEAFTACGLDAALNYYEADTPESSQWQVEAKTTKLPDYIRTDYTIHTPEGDLTTAEGIYNAKYTTSVSYTDNEYELAGWTPNRDELLPYPENEIEVNPNIDQNPGYASSVE